MTTYGASTNVLIREMGASQLEEYIKDLWEVKYSKNFGVMLKENYNHVVLAQTTYTQLTGNDLLKNISEEFTNCVNEYYK